LCEVFARQLEGLREQLARVPPPSGTLRQRFRRAVGCLNRDYLTVFSRLASDPAPDISWVHSILQMDIPLAGDINRATPAEVVEGGVDGLRFELSALRD
jgi:hypothetical protein